MNNKAFVLGAVSVCVIGGLAYFAYISQVSDGGNRTDELAGDNQNRQGLFDMNTLDQNAKIYTSDNLGIAFSYAPLNFGMEEGRNSDIQVKEIDTTIYVYDASFDWYTDEEIHLSGQSVEVFEKQNPTDTLQEAIQNQFLSNISEEDCKAVLVDTDDPVAFSDVFRQWTLAEIVYTVPSGEELSIQNMGEYQAKCGEAASYTLTNGMQYFVELPGDSSRFLFLRIGQGLVATSGKVDTTSDWFESIRMIR